MTAPGPQLPPTVRASALTRAEQRRAPVYCYEHAGRWSYARRAPMDGSAYWLVSTIYREGRYFYATAPVPAPARAVAHPSTTAEPVLQPSAIGTALQVRGLVARALKVGQASAEGWPEACKRLSDELAASCRQIDLLETQIFALRDDLARALEESVRENPR